MVREAIALAVMVVFFSRLSELRVVRQERAESDTLAVFPRSRCRRAVR